MGIYSFSLSLQWPLADELDFVYSGETLEEEDCICVAISSFTVSYFYRTIIFNWKIYLLMGFSSQRLLIDLWHWKERWLLEKGYKLECKKGLCAECACSRWWCSEAFPTKGTGWCYSTVQQRQGVWFSRWLGSCTCRYKVVYVYATENLALLCWKTLLLTAASFVHLADFIIVAWELCNGCVRTIPKTKVGWLLFIRQHNWDCSPWELTVCVDIDDCFM